MVRVTYPPSQIWQLRVTRCLLEVRLALRDISGACIGEHAADSGCSRTHYHIFYKHTKVTSHDTFVKYFKTTYNLTLKSNADFACKPSESLENWYQYVYGGPDPSPFRQATEIMFNLPESQRPYPLVPWDDGLIISDMPLPENLLTTSINVKPVKESSKRDPCYMRFWAYVKDLYTTMPTDTDIVDAWIDWTDGNYELRNVSGPIRYALWRYAKRFNNGDLPQSLRDNARYKLLSQI